MTAAPYLALDVGAASTRVASHGTLTRLVTSRTPGGTTADRVRAALSMSPRPAAEVCFALPDAWFRGDVAGVRSHEEVRQACEDEGAARVIWAGQLAAVAASCATRQGPGRYLVCDIGYGGVRAGLFTAGGGTVRTEAALGGDGGGWSDFDRAVRAAVGHDRLPENWYAQAIKQADRARAVFENAMASPDHGDDRAYRLAGQQEHRLTARQVMECFAPVTERLAAGIAAVSGAGSPDAVVLTGGLGWFPLAALTVKEMTGLEAAVTGPDEAVRGALLFARGQVSAAPPDGLGTVSLPVNRVRAGLLEEQGITLPWDEPFARLPGDMPPLDQEELTLMISGQYRTVRLPGLVPGPHRIGVRAGWSGTAVLVVRPAAGNTAHVVSLAAAGAW